MGKNTPNECDGQSLKLDYIIFHMSILLCLLRSSPGCQEHIAPVPYSSFCRWWVCKRTVPPARSSGGGVLRSHSYRTRDIRSTTCANVAPPKKKHLKKKKNYCTTLGYVLL